MSYEDLQKAKAERVAKETSKIIKKAEKEAKKVAKEAKEATASKNTRGRKRKSAADAPQPQALSKVSEPVDFQMCWSGEEQQVAPVARMY
jgi:hypothetical protein